MRKFKTVYRFRISALVPDIFKFEKLVKYANEITLNPISYQVLKVAEHSFQVPMPNSP